MFDHEQRAFRLRSQQRTREENSKLVFDLINSRGGITRVELVGLTGLSPSTVSSLVDDLVSAELVTETGHARLHSGAGRRPIVLTICPSGRQIPVFSLSRSGVRYTLFDLAYNVLEEKFCPCCEELHAGDADALPVDQDAAKARGMRYIGMIEEMLTRQAKVFDRRRADAVLVSYPGFYVQEDDVYVLASLQTAFLREEVQALGERLGLTVFMGNSSMSLAYAEKKRRDAAGEKLDNLVYFNICEGVGAGIICDGQMFMRRDRIAGEIGHVTVEIGGLPCACGNRGCLERYVNAEAIVSAVRAAAAGHPDSMDAERFKALSGNPTMEEIGKAYDAGIAPVRAALDAIAEKLFVGINNVVNVTGIRCVVIGGIGRLGSGFLEKLRSFLNGRHWRMLMRGVHIEYAAAGEQADSIGLAQYFIDKLFTIKGAHGHDLPAAMRTGVHKP